MSRPSVSVVMPFAGSPQAARQAIAALQALVTSPQDELILADNSGTAEPVPGVKLVRAERERSPAHARNAGGAAATTDWILFLDADCVAPPQLIDAYFTRPPAPDTGAIAGEVTPLPGDETLASRYAASRSFLGQQAHIAHPFRPRAAAANLLVRRAAFEQVGGFLEGLRAAEDTDFSWRLQAAGWRLELCPEAVVAHRYRESLRDLRRQWRGYAAGRAWLARRYQGFSPEPAVERAARRAAGAAVARARGGRGGRQARLPRRPQESGLDRARFRAIDAILAADELAGFTLSNRPQGEHLPAAAVVLVADRFPAAGDPMVDFARSLDAARVEAVARPDARDDAAARVVPISYREDDGALGRVTAFISISIRHPVKALADRVRRRPGEGPSLPALAPAVRRLDREPPGTAIHPLAGELARRTAARLAALTGREVR